MQSLVVRHDMCYRRSLIAIHAKLCTSRRLFLHQVYNGKYSLVFVLDVPFAAKDRPCCIVTYGYVLGLVAVWLRVTAVGGRANK